MRALTRGTATSVLIVASLCTAGTAAHADELLVMPYACSMAGGRPVLTPAPEQSHRVIGPREQRTHTACSPADPEMCRSWTVHRFDLDCDGTRVPWVAVVAAASDQTNGRAWVEDGRLRLRMPRGWSFAPDDPCARAPGFDDRFGFGRMRRYCDDRRAMAPPVVEMPAGFAPMLGIDGIFVRSLGPPASNTPPAPPAMTPPPAPKVAQAEPQALPESPQPPRGDPIGDRPAKDAPAKNRPPAQVAIQQPPPAAAPPSAPIAKQAPPAAPAPPAATPGSPVIPKIINRPDASTSEPAEPPPAAAAVPKVDASPDPSAKQPSAVPASPKNAERQESAQPQPKTGPARDVPSVTVSLISVASSPVAGAVALGGLALILLAAFVVARRREHVAGARPRDFAAASLAGRAGRGNVGHRSPAPPRQSRVPASVQQPPVPTAPTQPAVRGLAPALVDRIPQTRAEAMQILGMGVSPDASETAMKKVVDGLRLSWHPDLAKDEVDRQLREFRVKQINTAWDLIQGKRMQRLDS